ncbi:Fpg/Nei family DNA glycosylase [Vampirovibrio chlorellavorus]|uniref:Fpg/Nei family DNA glycosylase n=1 Tax=Vampirovibrio chlorellavorus TaxID=758823 RepID=UPI0026EEC902|nr:DNA-formamidopyrimidine glycosylase family protein [Vampirovibrio chlorellavorus]
MPELPEVETFRRFTERYALHSPVTDIRVFRPKILENTTEAALQEALTGRCLGETRRVGKHLLVKIAPLPKIESEPQAGWLFLHFGMTGYLSFERDGQTVVNAYGNPALPQAHIRVQLVLADGGLFNFHEQRMFGKLGLTADADRYFEARKLGPDALNVDRETFVTALQKRKGQLKPALMDQSLVAGVGNVYADEALYQSGLHPGRQACGLSAKEAKALHQQVVDVLQRTVDVAADRDHLPAHYMLHQRHPKAVCPKAGHPLHIAPFGGRTTYFCSVCQA